jgi:pyroglutamyl-peptidase
LPNLNAYRIDLLITGFGPFPGVPRNPSAILAMRLASNKAFARMNVSVSTLIMPTSYAAIDRHLLPALQKQQPRAVLMLGVAARRKCVCIEKQAINRVSRLFPDAHGQTPQMQALEANADAQRCTRAPKQQMLLALRGRNIPARISHDAGRYLCNATYFAALGEARKSNNNAPHVIFIHVPMPKQACRHLGRDRRPSLQALTQGLIAAARELLRHAPKQNSSIHE